MSPVLNLVQTLQAATMKGIFFFIKVCQLGYSDNSILCQYTNTEGVRVKERESIKKKTMESDKKEESGRVLSSYFCHIPTLSVLHNFSDSVNALRGAE